MQFLEFWWKHSLRNMVISFAVIVSFAWISGYVHWFMYSRYAGENHWYAALATFTFWIVFWVVIVLGYAVIYTVYDYLKRLWNSWKSEANDGAA